MFKKRLLALVLTGTMAVTNFSGITAFAAVSESNSDSVTVVYDESNNKSAADIVIEPEEKTSDEEDFSAVDTAAEDAEIDVTENDEEQEVVVSGESSSEPDTDEEEIIVEDEDASSVSSSASSSEVLDDIASELSSDVAMSLYLSAGDPDEEAVEVDYDAEPIPYTSRSGEIKSPNVSILLNLVNERQFVIDTFWGDSTPSNSPYFNGSDNFLYQDIYNNYEKNPLYKAAVDAYYRLLNMEEGAAELWEAAVGLTMSDADKANFKNGVAAKNYEAVLSKTVSTNYTSSIGLNTNSESAGLLALRADYQALKSIDDVLGELSESVGQADDCISEDEREFVLEALPAFRDGKLTYLEKLDFTLKRAESITGKDEYKSIYDAEKAAHVLSDSEKTSWEENESLKKIFKNYKFINTIVSDGLSMNYKTLQELMLIESLDEQMDSLYKPIDKTHAKAVAADDKAYASVSRRYVELMNADYSVEESVKRAYLKTYLEVVYKELAKYAIGKIQDKITDSVIKLAVGKTASMATSMYLAQSAETTNLIIGMIQYLGDKLTGVEAVTKKIYEIKYLKKVKEYAKQVYNDDYAKFKDAYNSGASMEELDPLQKMYSTTWHL